jgi:3-oxoacyl-[acyl-carrier-protein] synthase III
MIDFRKWNLTLKGPSGFLPPKKISNEEICRLMSAQIDSSWIVQRTGVEFRHWVEEGVACSDLAAESANSLLRNKNISLREIKGLYLATVSPDHSSPPTAPLICQKLGLSLVRTLDLNLACAGFTGLLYQAGLDAALSQEPLMLCSSEVRSCYLNPDDTNTFPLFGDGSACALLESNGSNADFRLLGADIITDTSLAKIIGIEASGTFLPPHRNQTSAKWFLQMENGPKIFVAVVRGLEKLARMFCEKMGVDLGCIDWIVPHQANKNILMALTERLERSWEKTVCVIEKMGNTSGASVGLALGNALNQNLFLPGQKILLLGAGAGGVGAAALLEKTELSEFKFRPNLRPA